MAKKSKINKNNKRIEVYLRYRDQVEALKKAGDYEGLQKLPRDASITRIRNRDSIDGRPRGYISKFGFQESNLENWLQKVKYLESRNQVGRRQEKWLWLIQLRIC